jgi:acetyl-CoA carboxylase carboxyl transferase subunit beta
MKDSFNFKKPKNALEFDIKDKKQVQNIPQVPDDMYIKCLKCKSSVLTQDFKANMFVCPYCNDHYRMGARERIMLLIDGGSFTEFDAELVSTDIIGFPDYEQKLQKATKESGEKDAVISGVCKIGGLKAVVFAMEPRFMMGSMGVVVGEKITNAFEYAAKNGLPVIGFTVSGGARMQEGIFSLMQMAKTSAAVKRHSGAGLLYIAVLTDPTTGGVTASFAMEADITLAEPKATVGFAGQRVIEQTMRSKLPPNFQTSEFLLEKGFIDSIVNRNELKTVLFDLLKIHNREVATL